MNIKKRLIFFSLLPFSSFVFLPTIKINSVLIDQKVDNEKNVLFGGSSSKDENDKKEPTEEEIKEAKKLFWIEFGVTASFFALILICFISFIVIKKKKSKII